MKRKPGIMALVIILLAGNLNLLGQIKAAGKLLIPTAGEDKSYKGFITITQAEIKIECDKKIFQRFNEFNSSKTREIKVNTSEVREIILRENKILILTKTNFHKRYRHLFHLCTRWRGVFIEMEKDDAMIFIFDNPGDIDFLRKRIIKLINKRCKAINATFE